MTRGFLWAGLLTAIAAPLILAAFSPLLAWRQPVYIAAGFAGIAAFGGMLAQPFLVRATALGLSVRIGHGLHRALGWALAVLVLAHVIGLWITSPPDVIDVLLFRSPAAFSIWGVLAMWALFGVGMAAIWRRKLGPKRWRRLHLALLVVLVPGTIAHVLLIEGTMDTTSKWALSALLIAACVLALKPTRRVRRA